MTDSIHDQFRAMGVSAQQAEERLKILGKIMRKIQPLKLKEIAAQRIDQLWSEYGPLCFLLVEWWRWAWMLITSKPEAHNHD